MTSLAEHLLGQIDSQIGGDIVIVVGRGDEKVRSSWHSCVLSRCQYFARALTSSFTEGRSKEFVFDDVSPKHLNPLLRALYLDSLIDKDIATLTPSDILEMLILCERLMVPESVAQLLYKQFEVACRQSDLDAEGCLDMLAFSSTSSLPSCITAVLLSQLKRKLIWGQNVLASLAIAYEKNVLAAADLCLEEVTYDCDAMRAEVSTAHHSDDLSPRPECTAEAVLAVVGKVATMIVSTPIIVTRPTPQRAVLERALWRSNSIRSVSPRVFSGVIPAACDVYTINDIDSITTMLQEEMKEREASLLECLLQVTSIARDFTEQPTKRRKTHR